MSLSRSLDLPALGRVDTLAQELALLKNEGKRTIAFLGSRHVPVVSIHIVELIARSLAQDVNPSLLTVFLPQSLDRQTAEVKDLLGSVLHLIEKEDNNDLPLPMASSLCNQEIINRCDQLICFAFHDSETLLSSCHSAEDMGKIVSLMFFD